MHAELREHVLGVRPERVTAHPELFGDLSGDSPSAMRWRISSSRGVRRSIRCARFAVDGAAAAERAERLLDLAARVERFAPVGTPDRVGEVRARPRSCAGTRGRRPGSPGRATRRRPVPRGRSPRCPGCSSWIRRVASMPSTPGIWRSIEHHVGVLATAVSTAAVAVGDDLDDGEVVLLVEGDLERLAERTMIVGDDDGDLGPSGSAVSSCRANRRVWPAVDCTHLTTSCRRSYSRVGAAP